MKRPSTLWFGFMLSAVFLVAYAVAPTGGTTAPDPVYPQDLNRVIGRFPKLAARYQLTGYGSLGPRAGALLCLHVLNPPFIATSLLLDRFPRSPFRTENWRWVQPSEATFRYSAAEHLHTLWLTDGRFVLQCLLVSALWWGALALMAKRLASRGGRGSAV
jgi:hypothetical protein